ncbi:hypothetical protein IEQ_05141 [Bacillus cereus BAG6X1-2]|nr:hypothetical protein IEQ_05141 [Bacillus cereus BAG6X1-2]
MNKQAKDIQIKFTVDEEQKKRLDILAKSRELTVPQFAKLSSLGVKITAAPIIHLGHASETEKVKKELEVAKRELQELQKLTESKELLDEILEWFDTQYDLTDRFIKAGMQKFHISRTYNQELVDKINAILIERRERLKQDN